MPEQTHNININVNPDAKSMEMAKEFMHGKSPAKKKMRPNTSTQPLPPGQQGFPMGLTPDNMIPFSQTPAGQMMLSDIMKNMQARGQG